MKKLQVSDMDTLIKGSDNHKILTLFRVYGSITKFPKHQANLVAEYFGYKMVQGSNLTYFNIKTGDKIAYKDVELLVKEEASKNRKIQLILNNYKVFSLVNEPQKRLILNHIGLDFVRDTYTHFNPIK